MSTSFGTNINDTATIVREAGVDIKKAPGKAVKIENGKFVPAAAGENAIGVIVTSSDEDIESGSDVTAQIKDIGIWIAGEAISEGEEITSDANGFAKPAGSGDFITAVALEEAATEGIWINVQLIKAGYKA